ATGKCVMSVARRSATEILLINYSGLYITSRRTSPRKVRLTGTHPGTTRPTRRPTMNAITRTFAASLLALAVHADTAGAATPAPADLQAAARAASIDGKHIVTADGVRLYYKDWGPKDGPVVTFSHGWPLNSDSWESQMLFLAANGYRVVAHDRRGHGRSSQPWDGNDMDHYADDLASVIAAPALRGARPGRHRPPPPPPPAPPRPPPPPSVRGGPAARSRRVSRPAHTRPAKPARRGRGRAAPPLPARWRSTKLLAEIPAWSVPG